MIRYHNGPQRVEFSEIEGRIVLISDQMEGFKKPSRVVSDDGRFVIVDPMKRKWSATRHAHLTTDEPDSEDRQKIDKRSIRVSCDNASEAEAILEIRRQGDEARKQFLEMWKEPHRRLDGLHIEPQPAVVYDPVLKSWVNPDDGSVITEGIAR